MRVRQEDAFARDNHNLGWSRYHRNEIATVSKRLIILSICLLLGGCSWWPWGGDQEDLPSPPKIIGVISAISDHITVIDAAGGGGWARRTVTYPLGDWQIDQLAADQAGAWLQKKGFEVHPAVANRAAFKADALGGPVSRGGWLGGSKKPDFAALIQRNVQPAGLPYYLILVEASGNDGLPDMHGIGLVRFSGRPQAFVLYHAFLVDGRTGATIDDIHADPKGTVWGSGATQINGPNTDLPKAAWPKQVDTWSSDQQAAFRDAIETEVKASLKANLPRLDLL
jgi:hypothetical protein